MKGNQYCCYVAPLLKISMSHSDKTLAMLTKHIHHELLPTLDEEDESLVSAVALALPLSTVEEAIKAVLTRNNYGVEAPSGVKIPAGLCVWRWEVQAQHMDWLPKNCREKAEARLVDRIQVSHSNKTSFFQQLIDHHRQGST
jgi:chromatin assembly factor 1 subunit A